MHQLSPLNNLPVCFTTEASNYARSSFFASLLYSFAVILICCQSRRDSCISHNLNDPKLFLTISVLFALLFAGTYITYFNILFDLRDVTFNYFGIASIPFLLLQLLI